MTNLPTPEAIAQLAKDYNDLKPALSLIAPMLHGLAASSGHGAAQAAAEDLVHFQQQATAVNATLQRLFSFQLYDAIQVTMKQGGCSTALLAQELAFRGPLVLAVRGCLVRANGALGKRIVEATLWLEPMPDIATVRTLARNLL